MTSLKEFLQTASADHSEALTQARAYEITQGAMVDATTVNGVLTDFGLISEVKRIANDSTHPAHNILLGVYTGLLGNHPFNFIQNSLTGQHALAQLNWLIETGLPSKATELTQFRDLMLWHANVAVYPFANITLHDVLIASDACPTKPVAAAAGFVTITTTADCEKHNPRLLALNPRTANWQRINSFMGVEKTGVYDAAVPPQFNGWQLAVDNAYEVL